MRPQGFILADESSCSLELAYFAGKIPKNSLAPVVQKLDNAIHRINHYPVDSAVCFVNTYPLDSDLSGG